MIIVTPYLLVAILTFTANSLQVDAANLIEEKARQVEITYGQQLQLNIAPEAMNRINFDNQRIVKLIGNLSSFNHVLSEQGQDLFISPRVAAGKKIDFSVLLASGDIMDLSLNIAKSRGPSLIKLKFPDQAIAKAKSEAMKMIENMRLGLVDKYYVQQISKSKKNQVSLSVKPELKVIASEYYQFGELVGLIVTIENQHHKQAQELIINEIVANFDRVAAIAVDHITLPARGRTKAYIVFKRQVV